MQKKLERKSAVDLTELAVGIVILGIVVSIGAVILANVAKSQVTNLGTNAVLAEALTPSTTAQASKTWFKSLDFVYNTSDGVPVNPANFTVTVNSDNGIATISNASCNAGGKLCSSGLSMNYTVYNTSDVRYSLPQQGVAGLGEYGNWFKILVIVGIAAVILALIFMAFGNRGSGGGEGAVSY